MQFFEDIHTWAEQRQLLDIEFDKLTQSSFIAKELSEFLRAKKLHDEVDALCDLVVFATNATYLLSSKIHPPTSFCYGLNNSVNFVDALLGYADTRRYDKEGCAHELSECLTRLISAGSDSNVARRLVGLVAICLSYIEAMGFDVEIAMNETVKEINSRVGALNELGKWEKDKSPNAQANWYKADYGLAEIK